MTRHIRSSFAWSLSRDPGGAQVPHRVAGRTRTFLVEPDWKSKQVNQHRKSLRDVAHQVRDHRPFDASIYPLLSDPGQRGSSILIFATGSFDPGQQRSFPLSMLLYNNTQTSESILATRSFNPGQRLALKTS